MRGFTEAISGILVGVIQGIIFSSFAENGLIPTSVSLIFAIVGIGANIATIFSFKIAGLTYTLGWLFGSLLLMNLLTPVDFITNIIVPIIWLGVKIWYFITNGFD